MAISPQFGALYSPFHPRAARFDAFPRALARVKLVYDENSAREKRETFVSPLRSIGEPTPVKSFIHQFSHSFHSAARTLAPFIH